MPMLLGQDCRPENIAPLMGSNWQKNQQNLCSEAWLDHIKIPNTYGQCSLRSGFLDPEGSVP